MHPAAFREPAGQGWTGLPPLHDEFPRAISHGEIK